MKAVGGYFELELHSGNHYHSSALRLNTARNCMEYILRSRNYKKVYVPYYTCEAILEPLKKTEVDWEFYHINQNFEPTIHYQISNSEAFLYTNYFGLKQVCVKRLAEYYGNRLIVDNSQAFFAQPIAGIDTFYSARKFFGVSDGAYLYIDKLLDINIELDVSYSRMNHLLKRLELPCEEGYIDFQCSEHSLCSQPIKQMSLLTERILLSIDYKNVKMSRQENFVCIHELLSKKNLLELPFKDDDTPMCYPFLSQDITLRERLLKKRVYVATYWPNVLEWCTSAELEYSIAQNMLPLPIDQRYGKEDINNILNIIYDGV